MDDEIPDGVSVGCGAGTEASRWLRRQFVSDLGQLQYDPGERVLESSNDSDSGSRIAGFITATIVNSGLRIGVSVGVCPDIGIRL